MSAIDHFECKTTCFRRFVSLKRSMARLKCEGHEEQLLQAVQSRSSWQLLVVGNDNLQTQSSGLWILSPFIRSLLGSLQNLEESLLILPDFSHGDIRAAITIIEGRKKENSVISQRTKHLLETLGSDPLSRKLDLYAQENEEVTENNVEHQFRERFNSDRENEMLEDNIYDYEDVKFDHSDLENDSEMLEDIDLTEKREFKAEHSSLDGEESPKVEDLVEVNITVKEEVEVEEADGRLYCDHCQAHFASKPSLTAHTIAKHSDTVFRCDQCDFQTKWKASLRTHRNKIHSEKRDLTEESPRTVQAPETDGGLSNPSSMSEESPTTVQAPTAGSERNPASLSELLTVSHVWKYCQEFKCPSCDKEYSSRVHLVEHYRSKHEGIKYPCTQCEYQASRKSDLRTHVKNKHEGVRYPCPQCDHKATHLSHLKRHIHVKHGGTKFPCPWCEYQCSLKSRLDQHIASRHSQPEAVSTVIKEFKCPACSKEYTNKAHMLEHFRSKHEGIKYPCNQCEYQASHKSDLRTHVKNVHEGVRYPCPQCDFKATHVSHLKRHLQSRHKDVELPSV